MATENGSQATIDDNIKKLFDAMDIIAAQQVKNLQFDKTVKCSITDDSKSEQGEYTVTDGSSTFKAYSESTKYSNGASVYVNIPNGDYNNKKLITGRYDQDRNDYNTNDDVYTIFNIYCATQKQSLAVKEIAKQFNAKYFVTESKNL